MHVEAKQRITSAGQTDYIAPLNGEFSDADFGATGRLACTTVKVGPALISPENADSSSYDSLLHFLENGQLSRLSAVEGR
ncbi:hypothetical protein [Rhizobium sp. BK491]|uniref:hypothetical protein n=1 Tax=Rhizobium sp. BK491 TaxID=2587009 RepID=UPI00161BDF02|nr:hypothetical protein [Rhizobium sp. BK491]MBB3572030.1 hypothetical protein [Rhizobium sp. BK491]